MRRFKSWLCKHISRSKKREVIRRDLAERMKFVSPDLRVGESVFHWQEDPSKIQQGRKSRRWLKVEIIAVKGPMVVINTGASIYQVHANKLRRPFDTGFEHGVEIRIDSVNKDNSYSWVRISHGLNKSVTDLCEKEYDDDEQETSEMKSEEFALRTNVLAFASRSKAKAKPRRRTSASSSKRTISIGERTWTDIEPGTDSNIAFPGAKRLNTLLRHGQLHREEDGAIEFWRLKDCLRYEFENSQYWSDNKWKSKMAGGGDHKKRFQYCTDSSGQEILYLRALQGHSGRNPIDPSLKDNVLIPDNFFEYIYHIGCAISLHSITNSGILPGRQNLGKERQTVFFTAVNSL